MDGKTEDRFEAEIIVRVWGLDADGKPFFQNANAGNLTQEGALLSGIMHPLKPGDIIGIQHDKTKARFQVVSVKQTGALRRHEVCVQILPNQQSPWQSVSSSGKPSAASDRNQRRFRRHKVLFPIEINVERSRLHLQTNATDIGGRGCYVETMLPPQLGTELNISFWIESNKVQTSGIVRTSDPLVGMGIEFLALDAIGQERLQAHLDQLEEGLVSEAVN